MPKEGEDRSIKDEVSSFTDVINEDTTTLSKVTENVESESELLKDSMSQDVSKSQDDSAFLDEMIILDTTAEASADEIGKSSYELVMPEGVCLDTDGDETSITEDITRESRASVDVVPDYETDIAGILSDVEYSMITGKKINDARPKKRCFNCLGDHNLADCPDPQDPAKIATNRKKHMNTRGANVRYHEDSENKFGHFQPGKISEGLRHALGLKQNQLPLFIYRMRVLGYPPGWLLDAEVHQADVKMYDASGKSVSHPDTEEGEDEPSSVKYKPERLVSFPGFNDPTPRGVRDEWQQYNCIPMQHCHQRTEFLKFMNMNKAEAYKKKKLKGSEMRSKSLNDSIAAGAEMDVDESEIKSAVIEFNPPLPKEPLPPPPPLDLPPPPQPDVQPPLPPPDVQPPLPPPDVQPPLPPPDVQPPLPPPDVQPPLPPPDVQPPLPKRMLDVEDGEISEDSQASLGDLEVKRLKILKELEDASSQGANLEGGISRKSKDVHTKNVEQSTENSEDSRMSNNSVAELTHSENSSNDASENDLKCHHRSHSKSFKLGAVIPESCTPYNTLPSAEKWTVDVSDHIVFENLPDALGTWQKMKGVMNVVKKRMAELHEDEDE